MSEIIDKSNKKVNLFFTNTPYHILLAIAFANSLIQSENCFENNLIIIDNFNGAAIFKKSLELWGNNPFNRIWILDSDSSKTRLEHYITERKKVNEIKKIIKNSKPKFLYTNNDVSNIGKAIIMHSKKFRTCKCIYVEDGIEPYLNNGKGKKLSQFRLMMQKIIYGKHSMYVPFHGANPGIDEINCNYPELIDKKKFIGKKIKKINFNIYRVFEDLDFVKILLSFMKIDIDEILKIKYIFVLPHSDLVKNNPIYFKIIKKYINKKNNNIAIKYHPREKNIGYFKLENESIYSIPKVLPIELIYLILKEKKSGNIIIGLRSTSLMTSRIILPESETYILITPSDSKKYSYTKYKKIGVKFINIE